MVDFVKMVEKVVGKAGGKLGGSCGKSWGKVLGEGDFDRKVGGKLSFTVGFQEIYRGISTSEFQIKRRDFHDFHIAYYYYY